LEAAAREAFEACDAFVGVFPKAREAREAGSRSALGMARNWEDEAGSSQQQPGAARDMPIRACLPRKRGKQGALGKQRRKE